MVMMNEKKGILLINLGTPDSPSVADVRKYLREFLMDPRVIDINAVGRTLLVKGIIAPFRGPKSAKSYKAIWTEQGSPLMVYGLRVKELLQTKLGENYVVDLAMRYQSPSIESVLNKFYEKGIFDIKVIPLFPQYASATTGSVHEKVMEIVAKWQIIPKIEFVNSYYNNPIMIDAFAEIGKSYSPEQYDHVLFSFHGLPKRQLVKSDPSKQHCQKIDKCCEQITENNRFCYSAQCYQTAYGIAEKLGLQKTQFSICFQSRLGRDPWITPYTSEVIEELAKQGKKRILVFCPAFVADCLETIFEIAEEYQEEFVEYGGEKVQLVTGLNDHPKWIDALEDLALNA
jgi:protoporphyrin/coproporphyrin ferrochelatase